MDPIDPRYAPPAAPIVHEDPPQTSDPLGWALLVTPVVAGLAQAFLPWTLLGTVVGYAGLLATVVLIGVDASRRRQPTTPHVVGAILLWLVFYPLYMHRRASWGAPRRAPFAIAAALFFTAGAFYRPLFVTPTQAYVRCKPAGKTVADGFGCSIEHTAGSSTAKVCWDLVLTCANGPGGAAHACGDVVPKQTTQVSVPYSSVKGTAGCDTLTKIDVTGLVLTE